MTLITRQYGGDLAIARRFRTALLLQGFPVRRVLLDQTVSGSSGIAVNHAYPAVGNFNAKVTAVGTAGTSSSPAFAPVTISVAALEGNDLFIGGTAGNDIITIVPTSADGQTVAVIVNGLAPVGSPFSLTGVIVVYSQSGTDTVQELTNTVGAQTVRVAIPAIVFGGAGNKTFSAAGSSANNVLVGGSGNQRQRYIHGWLRPGHYDWRNGRRRPARGQRRAVGSTITFRYQELSDGGVPRFPSFVGVRKDVQIVTPAPPTTETTKKAAAPEPSTPERPDTPLALNCLLTGTRLDPSLASQLRKEIRTADQIDIHLLTIFIPPPPARPRPAPPSGERPRRPSVAAI